MYSPGRPYIVVAPVVTSWAVAGQRMVFFHMFLQARVTLEAFPIVAPRGRSSKFPWRGTLYHITNFRFLDRRFFSLSVSAHQGCIYLWDIITIIPVFYLNIFYSCDCKADFLTVRSFTVISKFDFWNAYIFWNAGIFYIIEKKDIVGQILGLDSK